MDKAFEAIQAVTEAIREVQEYQNQNTIDLQEQIESLSVENNRLSCKNDQIQRKYDKNSALLGKLQQRIKSLDEENKRPSLGGGHRTFDHFSKLNYVETIMVKMANLYVR